MRDLIGRFGNYLKNLDSKNKGRVVLGCCLVLVLVLSAFILVSKKDPSSNLAQQEQQNALNSTEEQGNEKNKDEAITAQGWSLVKRNDEVNLMSRIVAGESTGEPYSGQVAVAAVLLNRVQTAEFPSTISGVIYQPHAFESVTNGQIWKVSQKDLDIAKKATIDALNGWDPTYGCIYFYNPSKPISSKWIWSRQVMTKIGRHVFAK